MLEPLVARRILPWFGGSAAVWSTCLVFYQTALLAGYLYARVLVRYLRPPLQGAVHIAFLAASLALLPVGPGTHWQHASQDHPAFLILRMLTVSIGLPFAALSASTPLLQAWFAGVGGAAPYRLFALSNLASLLALVAYPTLIEPSLGTAGQSRVWSIAFVGFAVFCATLAFRQIRSGAPVASLQPGEPVALRRKLAWFVLAACGSMLLLSVTNHLDANVAAIPLIWVLPLAAYLLSFVATFGRRSIYRRALWQRLLVFALGTLAYAIYNINTVIALAVSLPVFLAGLFVCCVFCHGELHRLRPPSENLTSFYLVIAGGGAAGSIAIGLAAPALLSGIYELPFTLLVIALVALALHWSDGPWLTRLLWAAASFAMASAALTNYSEYQAGALSLRRNFYGSLRVVQTPRAGPEQQRILFHGTIEHGAQFVQAPRRRQATTYYGADSGIGILLREGEFDHPKRVGVVGLGTGTLASYEKAGDEFHFYELNPQVIDIAQSLFFYLRESQAHSSIMVGDGRLGLERETGPPFDVLVLDAFSGDAIPVHLLTREALALYQSHLRANGVIAFHVSNDYLDLAPVVGQLAEDAGFRAVLVHNHADAGEAILPADWVLVTTNQAVLANSAIRLHARPIPAREKKRIWTDDYSDVWEVFRLPQLR